MSRRLGRAITIEQGQADTDADTLAAWIAVRRSEDFDGEAITEDLTLNLSLSEDTLSLATKLIEQWMDPGTSREYMEDLIDGLAGA